MARLALQELSKTFRVPGQSDVRALHGVTLEVLAGEAFALLGASGCGKTTLLRIVAGLESPTAGTLRFDDRDMRGVDPADRNVAMVFQSLALYPHLTVAGNLGFGLRLRGTAPAEIERRVREVARLLHIERLLARRPAALSGGERQRVAIGRALVRQPAVVLLDEPFASLDPPMRIELRAELRQLHARLGFTLVHVTHDQEEALALAQRVAVLREGEVQQVDKPLQLRQHPANLFVARFIGNPPINLIPGALHAADRGATFRASAGDPTPGAELVLSFPNLAPPVGALPRSVVLGVRPENLRVEPRAPDSHPGIVFEAEVERSETAGLAEAVHTRVGPRTLIGRAADETRLSPGARCQLRLDPEECLWFDADTGKALEQGSPRA